MKTSQKKLYIIVFIKVVVIENWRAKIILLDKNTTYLLFYLISQMQWLLFFSHLFSRILKTKKISSSIDRSVLEEYNVAPQHLISTGKHFLYYVNYMDFKRDVFGYLKKNNYRIKRFSISKNQQCVSAQTFRDRTWWWVAARILA